MQMETEQLISLAFTQDGQTLVAGGAMLGTAGLLTIWDVASRKERGTVKWKEGLMWGLALSHDGTLVATMADEKIRLWELPPRK